MYFLKINLTRYLNTEFITREIDGDIRFERMLNRLYKDGVKDKELYKEAQKYVEQNFTEYKDVRVDGCFYYGAGIRIRISYKSVFGMRFNKDIVIYTDKSVKRFTDVVLNEDKSSSNYSLWERCFNNKRKETLL